MIAREFAFWLQGYFELNGATDALDAKQAKQILTKLQTVTPAGNDVAEQKAAAFVNFAKGALSSVEYIPASEQGKVLGGITNKLRSDLNDLFVHAIDPTIQGDQQQHRKAHRPDNGGNGGLVAMC